MHTIAILLSLVFTSISGLHVYWGLGGRWGATAALPKKEDGTLVFRPGLVACFVVALGLLVFAYVCLAYIRLVPSFISHVWTSYAVFGLGSVFALRALGDFRYVGIFKRVRRTDFAQLDTQFYTPLCAIVAICLFVLALG